jgi:membrane fusion protein, multidrug efflux system
MSEAKREPIPLRREEKPAAPAPTLRRRLRNSLRGSGRFVLMMIVPLAILLAGAYVYLLGGRYVSTDDAYVKADRVTVSADVGGRVVEIAVHENEIVKTGQLLYRIDDRNYRIAVERAKAQFADAKLQIEGMRATYRQKQADLKAAQDTLLYQQHEFERQQQLLASHVASQAQYDAARHALESARQQAASVEQQIANVLASLGGDPNIPTDQHPVVLQAKAQLDQAELDLSHTTVTASTDGIVSHVDQLQVGDYLNAATPAFALVSTTDVWIEANFKETDLAHMRAGQEATIDIDSYPDKTFTAKVASISPGTGSEFSVLPPQNATGNWVKIVQRVPVRLVIENPDPERPLRIGMSANVDIDTKYRRSLWRLIRSAFADTQQP